MVSLLLSSTFGATQQFSLKTLKENQTVKNPFGIAPYNYGDKKGLIFTDRNAVYFREDDKDGTVTKLAGIPDHVGYADGCGEMAPSKIVLPKLKHFRDNCGGDSDSESESEIEYALAEGSALDGLALFSYPLGITSIGDTIFVADRDNDSVRVLERRMDNSFEPPKPNYLVSSIDAHEEQDLGGFDGPIGLASDKQRYVYVTDRKSIYEIDYQDKQKPVVNVIAGEMFKEYSVSGKGLDIGLKGHDTLSSPKSGGLKKHHNCDVGEDLAMELVPDSYSHSDSTIKLELVSADYNPAENIQRPCGIAYTEEGGLETLYYAEYDGNRVSKIIKDKETGRWQHKEVAEGLDKPFGVAIKDGDLYVSETGGKCIKIIKPDGTVETITGGTGTGDSTNDDGEPGKVADPRFLAVRDNTVYFADRMALREVNQNDAGNAPAVNSGLADATIDTINKATVESVPPGEQDFRFGLSTEQIMLTMRQRGVNFAENNGRDPYTRALNALEKTIDSTHAIRQIGKGMTIWASGLYTQGSLDSMFGNPAMKTKNYAIMVGGHYKDAATQQIFGVAVNVGFGNSIAKTDKDIRTDNKAAQITLYYNKKFDEEGRWKFSWHNILMRSMDRHQRPFVDNTTGNRLIAIGNGVTYEFASSVELSYKHEFSKDNFLKPFTALNYAYNKELAYKEENVGRFNRSYDAASTDQVGLQFGLKSSIGYKLSETKTFVVMPKVSYTLFTKMGHTIQPSTNINSGQTVMGQSGTPGRHLFSATLAIGTVDYVANTTTRFAYTGNVQKQKRSHELMLDWGMKF